MLHDITDVRPLDDLRLHLRFDDGVEGEVDLKPLVRFEGVFTELADPAVFAQVHVDPELGTVVWPTGADLCPSVLRTCLTGEPLPGQ